MAITLDQVEHFDPKPIALVRLIAFPGHIANLGGHGAACLVRFTGAFGARSRGFTQQSIAWNKHERPEEQCRAPAERYVPAGACGENP